MQFFKIYKNLICFTFFSFCFAITVHAMQTGSLYIRVIDQIGAFVPKATVRLKNEKGLVKEINSDSESVFFSDTVLGKYILEIEAKGFKPFSQEIEIKAGRNEIIVKLEIAEIVENVQVERDPQDKALDSQDGAFTNFLTREQLEALPEEPEDLERALKDQFGQDVFIRVDGFTGRLPPKSQIASIRVTRSSFDAEYHQLGSTFIDIISKAGGGKWFGAIWFNFNDELLNARNPFAAERLPAQERSFNAFFSGPIIKNKTSAFAIFSGENSYRQKNIFAVTPDRKINDAVSNFFNSFYSSIKISHNLGKGRSLNVSYNGISRNSSNEGVGGFDLLERAFGSKNLTHQFRVSETGFIGKRFLNEIRLQYTNETIQTDPVSDKTTIIVLDSFNAGGAGNFSRIRRQNFWLSDNLLFGAGKIHALKIGGLFEYENLNLVSAANQNGTFTFTSLADFQNNRPSTFTQSLGLRKINVSQIQIGVYIQDDIRLHRSFLLSAGLRWEWQNNLKDYSNFSPRLGFTWSPYKNGKMIFRGGAGIYYNWLETNNLATVLSQSVLQPPETVIINPNYLNPFQSGTNQILPQSFRQLAADLKNPYVFLSSFGMERQLSKNAFLRVIYKYQKGIHQFRSRDINAPLNFIRPSTDFGRIIQIESTAFFAQNSLNVEFNGSIRKNLSFTSNYTLSKTVSDNNGIFGLPSDNYNLRTDRSISNLDRRHRLYASVFWHIRKNLNFSTILIAASPLPYTITTGFDNNGDTIFNDRPSGLRRNTERGAWRKQVDMSLGWTIGLIKRETTSGGVTAVLQDDVNSETIGGGTNHKYSLKFSVRAYNIFNQPNFINFVGVQSSPFFHQPITADSPRRIELGMRFSF